VANGLKIVTAALLIADVRVDRCVSCSSREVLALPERDVLVIRVLVAFGEAEIDNVYVVLCAFCASNQEIVGFNVSVNYPFLMDLLNALDLQRVRTCETLPSE